MRARHCAESPILDHRTTVRLDTFDVTNRNIHRRACPEWKRPLGQPRENTSNRWKSRSFPENYRKLASNEVSGNRRGRPGGRTSRSEFLRFHRNSCFVVSSARAQLGDRLETKSLTFLPSQGHSVAARSAGIKTLWKRYQSERIQRKVIRSKNLVK